MESSSANVSKCQHSICNKLRNYSKGSNVRLRCKDHIKAEVGLYNI